MSDVDTTREQIIDLELDGSRHWFTVQFFSSSKGVIQAAKHNKNISDDTEAYCETWSNKDSIEKRMIDCCGVMYLQESTSAGVIAHEAMHMALGILNREGNSTMPITAAYAPEIEEQLGNLIDHITDEIYSSESKDQALDDLLGAMPEKRNGSVDSQTGAPVGMQGCVDHGFDLALADVTATIHQLKSSKKGDPA